MNILKQGWQKVQMSKIKVIVLKIPFSNKNIKEVKVEINKCNVHFFVAKQINVATDLSSTSTWIV